LNPDVLLVDEVLAVENESFQRKCSDHIDKFRSQGKTTIFVSHSAQDVKKICDRACCLITEAWFFWGSRQKLLIAIISCWRSSDS